MSECGCFGKFKCNEHYTGTGPVQVVKCNHLWPMVSDAMAVMPNQIAERLAACERAGVPTEHTPQGQPILRTPQHRREFAERIAGQIDQNSYGGRYDAKKVRW